MTNAEMYKTLQLTPVAAVSVSVAKQHIK